MKVQILSRKVHSSIVSNSTQPSELEIIMFRPACCYLAWALSFLLPTQWGRSIKENFSIECNDKGAEYLEAQVSGSLSQLLEREELETEMWWHLVPGNFQPKNSPLLTIQFNMFDCGGLAIGTCMAHSIADGYTIGAFVNAWATACRIGIEKVHCRPSFPFGSLLPPKNIPTISSVCDPTRGGEINKVVKKTFVFNRATISKLKEIAVSRTSGSNQLLKHQPTRVEVVTGLVWMILTKVAQAIHGHLRPSIFGIVVNMRGKTSITMPEYSCGNFVNFAIAQFMPDDGSKIELRDFVNRVHAATRSLVDDFAKASSGDDLFWIKIKKMREASEAWEKPETDLYMVSSLCRFPLYETDFGWGKPSWVRLVDKTNNYSAIVILDTKDGDGIEVVIRGFPDRNAANKAKDLFGDVNGAKCPAAPRIVANVMMSP
ncbi:unnamed protein product [Dovyalis caffra]|uniref:Uncharacterized protein n=1 Tax=Dovyalis caffra TaxID=77055 RepID=A0AAV1RXI7_9ROSI|nr:unnamed protein product [Dovyalis caffra]